MMLADNILEMNLILYKVLTESERDSFVPGYVFLKISEDTDHVDDSGKQNQGLRDKNKKYQFICRTKSGQILRSSRK